MHSYDAAEERAREAIRGGGEFPSVEFKGDACYSSLQYKIIKTCMAMSNLPDGGVIVIGVAQNGGRLEPVGVSLDNEVTYETETIYEDVNKYASPPIPLRTFPIAVVQFRFVAIVIPPFERTPVVCRRNSPGDVSEKLTRGTVYIRTGSPVASQQIQSAEQMEDLLQHATSLRLAATMRILQSSGATESFIVPTEIEREVTDIANFL